MKRFLMAGALLAAAALPCTAGSLILTDESSKTLEASETLGPLETLETSAAKNPALPPLYGANTPMTGTLAVAASPAAPAAASPAAIKSWSVRLDDLNLANAFARWGREAGYAVRWDARKNAVIEGPDTIRGSFEDAVIHVLSGPGIATSAYPLEVCFYPNTPPLARITRKGEQDKECK